MAVGYSIGSSFSGWSAIKREIKSKRAREKQEVRVIEHKRASNKERKNESKRMRASDKE